MAGTTRARDGLIPLLAFAGAMVLLHLLGRGTLAAPPLGSLAGLRRWAVEQDPTTVAMVVVRLLSLAVGYHLLFTSLMAVLGQVLRTPRLVTIAEAMTLPMFRSTAGRLAGLAISASTFVGGVLPTAGAAPALEVTVAAPLPTSDNTGPTLIERVAIPPTSAPGTTETTATIRAVVPSSVPTAEATPTMHRVQPGDHLWAIAETTLEIALGRAPTDAEVAPFWRLVIQANPDLVDPDLIFPGQVLVVPPASRPPA